MEWIATILGSILGSIILSVIGNILTDPVKNWLAKRSLVSKTKRIFELKKEADRITELKNDKDRLFFETAISFITILSMYLLGLVIGIGGVAFAVAATYTSVKPVDGFVIYDKLAYGIALLAGLVGGVLIWLALLNTFLIYNTLIRTKEYEKFIVETNIEIDKLSR